MNDCEKVRENLSAYIDDMLNDTEKGKVLTHLTSCQSCAEEYEFLKAISKTAKDMPELSVSPALHQSIMEKVMQEAERPKSKKISFWQQTSKFVAVAAVLVISLISLQSLPEHPEPTPNVLTEDLQTASDTGRFVRMDEENADAAGQEEVFYASSNNAKQNQIPATPQPTDAAKHSTESVNGIYQDAAQKAEDSLLASVSLETADHFSEETKPATTAKPIISFGSAGGGASVKTQEIVDYIFTESGILEAEKILAVYPVTASNYVIPYAEYDALHQKLSAVNGYIENTDLPESEDIMTVYIRLFAE